MEEKVRSSRVLLAGLLSAISLAYAGRCLWLGLSLVQPMPLTDQWAVVHQYLSYLDGHFSWADLFAQHNEHRLATTRVVLFADAILFGMRGLFPVALNYAILAAMAVIGAFLVSSRSQLERFTCFAAALGLLWSFSRWVDFLWPFNIQYTLVHFFAFTCFVALFCASRSRFFLWIAVALAADALGVFSLGSGLFVIMPALLLTLFLRTWRAAALLAAFHLALVVLYFVGYQRPASSLPYYFDPITFFSIVAEFIGLAFGKHEVIFGVLGLTLFAVVAGHISYLAVVRRPAHPACYILASLACFVILEAAVVGYVRPGFGIGPRYATASVVFWAALLGMLWKLTEHLRTRSLVPIMAGGAIIAMNAPQFEASWREHVAFLSRVTAEVRRGEFDSVWMERLCPRRCAVRPLRELQRLGIGPFLPGR
jgi:hypothetical protein